MDENIIKEAQNVIDHIIDSKDPWEKTGIILKIIPIECFDEVFRFFNDEEKSKLADYLEMKVDINSVETMMVIDEFIDKNNIRRYLKTSTLLVEETIGAFQKYCEKNPRKISDMIRLTWLES